MFTAQTDLSEASITAALSAGWDLADVALYVAEFRAPDTLTADTEAAWQGLMHHGDPSRWT